MDEYRGQVRTAVFAVRGILDNDLLLSPRETTPLDVAMMRFAQKNLSKKQMVAFYLAYYCTGDWQELQAKYYDHFGKTVQTASLQTMCNRALDELIANVKQSTDLNDWEKKYWEDKKNRDGRK